MIAMISGYAVPILLTPLVIWALQPLFARFYREAAQLFAEVDCDQRHAVSVGSTMAKVNVIVFMLIWLGVFTCMTLELQVAVGGAIVIAGLLVGLWLTTGIARNHLKIGGWSSVQVGLVTFAGGNLPMLLLIPIALAVRS